ncbi:hypothetical protein K3495_g4802 [Podosphaera aphanis]|nr:hypothetical protein K3495_g4802 [Podosphaera aphanis]
MSLKLFQERVTALQESNDLLQQLIKRLEDLQFYPGSVPLARSSEGAYAELVAEILQTTKEQDEDWELLKEELNDVELNKPDSTLEVEKNALVAQVRKAINDLKTYQTSFRRAQLNARRKIEVAQRQERIALIKSYLEPHVASPMLHRPSQPAESIHLSKEEQEINASSDVTAALRRAYESMANELSRSQYAHDTLRESTAALAQLSDSYSRLDSLLANSKNLLVTLLRSQKTDTWYLETAFYVLSATICWLIFRRFLYGPLWWFFWFPMKMFIKGWIGVFTAMGIFGRSGTNTNLKSPLSHITQISSPVTKTVEVSLHSSSSQRSDSGDSSRERENLASAEGFNGNMAEHIARILQGSPSQTHNFEQKKIHEEIIVAKEKDKKWKPKDEL